jgi:hypothetical protein
MHPFEQQTGTVTTLPFVSSTLGMRQFPVGTVPSAETGDHVMGAVVVAWLTHHPLERWGEAWASAGSMQVRFRSHLSAHLPLLLDVDHGSAETTMVVRDEVGTVFATAVTQAPAANLVRDELRKLRPPMLGMVPATAIDLADRTLDPMIFDFDADRDLGFVSGIADGRLWSERGWAHPGFLSAASNAILRRDVLFESPQHWKNTGFEVKMRRPIPSGSIIRFAAHIDRLFDSAHYRFAVCAIEASVDGLHVATIANTFAYGVITTDELERHP